MKFVSTFEDLSAMEASTEHFAAIIETGDKKGSFKMGTNIFELDDVIYAGDEIFPNCFYYMILHMETMRIFAKKMKSQPS